MGDDGGGIGRAVWNPEQRRLRAPFRIPAAFVLGILALQLVVGVVGWLASAVGLPDPLETVLVFSAMTGVAVAVTWFVDRRRLRDVGLGGARDWWLDLLAGLAVGLGMAATAVAALSATGFATVGAAQPVSSPDIRLGGGWLAPVYGLLFFGAVGLLEEFLVRGYLLVNVAEGLRGTVGSERVAVGLAVLSTAGLFGLLHAANPGGTALSLLNIALAGVFLGLAYAMTARLAFPIGVHVTWNFGLGPVFGLPVSGLVVDVALVPVGTEGSALVTGGSFGPEGGLVMLPALAVGSGALALWVRRREGGLDLDGSLAVPDLWTDGRGGSERGEPGGD